MSEPNNQSEVSQEPSIPKKRRRRKSSKRKNAKKIQTRALWIGAISIALPLLLLFGLYYYNRFQLPQNRNELVQSEPEEVIKKTFEQTLESGNSNELLKQLNELQDDASLPLPVRLNNLERSIATADALVNLNASEGSVRHAQKIKLSALADKIKIDLENNANDIDLAELSFFADSLELSKDEELREYAEAAKFFINFTRFSTAPQDSDSRGLYFSNSTKQLELLGLLLTNVDIARDIFDHISLANKKFPKGEPVKLMKKFVSGFESSPNASIAALAREMKISVEELQFRTSASPLANDLDSDAMLESFRNVVSSGQSVDNDSAIRWLNRAQALMAKDKIQPAKELFDLLSSLPNQSGYSELFQSKITMMGSRLNHLGAMFESQSLTDSNGENFAFSDNPNFTSIVLFASNSTIQQSQKKFAAIKNQFGKSLLSPNIQLCLVLIHAPGATDEIAVFRKLESKLRFIKALFLPDNSNRFRDLKNEFAIEQLPFLIVLQGEKVRAIEPDIESLEKILAGN